MTRVPQDANFVSDVRTKNRLSSYNPVIDKWYNYSYPGECPGTQACGLYCAYPGWQIRQNAALELLL